MKTKTRKAGRKTKPASARKTERAFVATTSDPLAAFLTLRGCHRVGISIERSGSKEVAAHGFEDAADKLLFSVAAFQASEDDDVSATRFEAMLAHLRKIRRDADRRLESEAFDEADRLKILAEDVSHWEKSGR